MRNMSESHSYYSHPTAVIESEAIGDGTKVWHFAHVRKGSSIGKNCSIGKSVYIDIDAEIGNNVKIQNFVSIYKGVIIDDDVYIGPSATFTNDLYPRAYIWDEGRVSGTRICRGASIGANATLVCGITVGEYAMIGAGSVVSEDVPPFALVLGNPCRQNGWVCHCGRKLVAGALQSNKETIYKCSSCGKSMEITDMISYGVSR
jgi:acetyltransferase-like isoleucine patch superfamily enzyme